MESESLKMQFFRQQLERGIRDIVDAQRLIATERIYQSGHDRIREQRDGAPLRGRSGQLMEALKNPVYRLSASGSGITSVSTVPLSMRFLDMKHLGNWQIYNRQIWGILYSETLLNIKTEWRDWIRQRIAESLNSQSQ